MEPLKGRIRTIITYPVLDTKRQTVTGFRLIPTKRHGDVQVQWDEHLWWENGSYRSGEFYYLIAKQEHGIILVTVYKGEVVSKVHFGDRKCEVLYPRWKKATLPTLIRYFGAYANMGRTFA